MPQLNGVRAKLLAEGDNEVDTMFVDRRGKHANGSTLVSVLDISNVYT